MLRKYEFITRQKWLNRKISQGSQFAVLHIEVLKILTEESVASTKNTQQMVSGLIKCIADTEEIAILLKEYANTLDEQIGYFVTEI